MTRIVETILEQGANVTFGAIAAGSAVAIALAVGLGSRDALARKMNDLVT